MAVPDRHGDVDPLGALALAFGGAGAPQEVYRALRDFVAAKTPMNGFFLARYDPVRELRTCVFAHTDGKDFDPATLPPKPMNGSPNSRAITTREVVIELDYMGATQGKPVTWLGDEVNPTRPVCSVVVPMVARGKVLGTMTIQSCEPEAFDDRHVAALRMAASLAALAVENLELLESERRASAVLETHVRERTEELERANADLRQHALARGLARRLLHGVARKGGVRPEALRSLGRELAGRMDGASLEDYVGAFALMGLGALRLEAGEGGRYTVVGNDLLERERGALQPTCFLTLGFLEGAVSALHEGAGGLGSEVACESRGHGACRFVVSARPHLRA